MTQILIGISLLINAVLIGYVIGYVELLLFVTILIACGLVWYIKKTMAHYDELDDDFYKMLSDMSGFENHLQEIYEMEMFYGDPTLESLIQHMGVVIDEISFYREKYFFLEDQQEEADDTKEKTPPPQK